MSEATDRFVCIHGHFYQPPRESPWLEMVEVQDSAWPYHDWNERITAECYEPNATSRILDPDGRISRIANNYAAISFNFGPTLLSWLEVFAPDTYRRILEADRLSQEQFSGHGSAMAQVYNHMIMPLANRRDKVTQVRWGIRDFAHRFGRRPEGMWLAETAVDRETLEVLAEEGILFTVLAPNQASEMRSFRGRNWHDVSGSRIDPTTPYEVRLPSKKRMHVFFYDGPISRAVAFEGLLTRGEHLADRLMSGFADHRDWPQLVHIATDGESYGHHHSHGDMALAYALHHLEEHGLARLTNYGEFLEKNPHPPEARIFDNSSWSCVHGVERWRSNCGCNSGGHLGWNQAWRGPLRAALDWLRDKLAPMYEEMAARMFRDPWAARDGYIDVILDRSDESVARFFEQHALHRLGPSVESNALALLEMQRHLMLMYTSCGWFFDELSGIETVQVISYAGRAVQLAEYLFEEEIESEFIRRLSAAKSNLPQHRDGGHLYEKWIKPAKIGLEEVGAHFAVSSLFEEYGPQNELFCYTVDVGDFASQENGAARLAVGNVTVCSKLTREKLKLNLGVIHLGDHVLHGGVRRYDGDDGYRAFKERVTGAFGHAEFPDVIRLLDQQFHASTYSLRSLFRDEQRKILNIILDSGPAERVYRQLYQHSAPLMSFLAGLGAPPPKAFRMAAEFILNLDLRRAIAKDEGQKKIKRLLDQAILWNVELDQGGLGRILEQKIRRVAMAIDPASVDFDEIEELDRLITIGRTLPFTVNFHAAQNVYYEALQDSLDDLRLQADALGDAGQESLDRFVALGAKLGVCVPSLEAEPELAVT